MNTFAAAQNLLDRLQTYSDLDSASALFAEAAWLVLSQPGVEPPAVSPGWSPLLDLVACAHKKEDCLLAIAEGRPDQTGPAWLVETAEYLAAPSRPQQVYALVERYGPQDMDARLLAKHLILASMEDGRAYLQLVHDVGNKEGKDERSVYALAEALLALQDNHKDSHALEQLWQALDLQDAPGHFSASVGWNIGELRRLSRGPIPPALEHLDWAEADLGWDRLEPGQWAVLSRWAKEDPRGAFDFVTQAPFPLQQASRLQAYCRTGSREQTAGLVEQLIPQCTDPKEHPKNRYVLACKLFAVIAHTGLSELAGKLMTRAGLPAWSVVESTWLGLRRLRLKDPACADAMIPLLCRDVPSGPAAYTALTPAWWYTLGLNPADILCVRSSIDETGPWWSPYGAELP